MKIVVLDSYATVGDDLSLDSLKMLSDDIKIYDRTASCDTVSRIGDAEIVILNKTALSKEVLAQCPNIRYIGLFSTGYNVVDIDYAKEKGIVVSNVPAYSTNGVAQLTFALILSFYNKVDNHNARVKNGEWQNNKDFCFYDSSISELCGKTIGIIGFGSIGKKVAQLARAFDMNVVVYSRTIYPEYEDDYLRFVELTTLLNISDIVSIHCPLFPETTNLINADTLSQMRPNAIVVNTSRGGVIDEQALADALNSGQIAGAGVDVVSVEPIVESNPLLNAKNCIITPHIAWAGKETRARLIDVVATNIQAFQNGAPQNNVAK